MESWRKMLSRIAGDCRVNITIIWSAGKMACGRDLTEMVEAMGVHVHSASATGLPSEAVVPPFAHLVGDVSQPGLQITWALLPEAKCTAQLNTKARTLAIKGKRGAVESQAGLLILFFGPPLSIVASAQATRAKAPPPATVDIRQLLLQRLA